MRCGCWSTTGKALSKKEPGPFHAPPLLAHIRQYALPIPRSQLAHMCRYGRGGASHSGRGRLVLLLTGRRADVLRIEDSMGPYAAEKLDPSPELDPGTIPIWVVLVPGFGASLRRSPGYLHTRMGVVALRLRVESDGKPFKPDPRCARCNWRAGVRQRTASTRPSTGCAGRASPFVTG